MDCKLHIHTFDLELCRAKANAWKSEADGRLTVKRTRHAVSSLGKVTITARQNEKPEWSFIHPSGANIEVKQSEYAVLEAQNISEPLPANYRRLFFRVVLFKYIKESILTLTMSIFLPAMLIGFILIPNKRPPSDKEIHTFISCLLTYGLTGPLIGLAICLTRFCLYASRPLKFIKKEMSGEISLNSDFAWLIPSKLIEKCEIKEVTARAIICDQVKIMRPRKDFFFRFDDTTKYSDNLTVSSPIHRQASTTYYIHNVIFGIGKNLVVADGGRFQMHLFKKYEQT